MPNPPRPGIDRQASSHNFAEGFQAARGKLVEPDFDNDTESFGSPSIDPGSDSEIPESPISLATSGDDSHMLPSPISPLTPADTGDDEDVDDEDLIADDFAFAFDIDGVLIRGGKPIPEAIEAMKVLNGENEYGIRIPYIFLTNGGGKFETERCVDLSRQLDITVSPGQFICGHTPMREFADRYKTVLVVGGEGEKCRNVAHSYGFADVVTPGDIVKANAAVAPFRNLTAAERESSRDLLEGGTRRLSDIVVDAVFVFADSRDWACDLQVILDVAMSQGGRLETRSESPKFDQGPPIYFSHSDVVWSAAHDHPRLGMGALRNIVESMFAQVTGGQKLVTYAFGKPQVSTFEFATRLLQQWRAQKHGLEASSPPDTVYFVGDTPESDIRGTNAMNAKSENEWYSILVKTGVYQDGTVPAHKPRKLVDTVLDAVNHGIQREMKKAERKAALKKAAPVLMSLDGTKRKRIVDEGPEVTHVEEAW